MQNYLRVGLIVRPHGVHGAVKITPLSGDLGRYRVLKDAYIEQNGKYTPVVVSDVGVREDAVYMSLSNSTSRESAEALRGAYIAVDRAHARKLPEGEYFVVDLLGCKVEDSTGNPLGELKDIYETGANDVYAIHGERKLLVPALKRLLTLVDIQNKRIVLDAEVLEEVGLFED